MAKTNLADVQEQVQQFWSDLFMDELRQTVLLPNLVNKSYDGEIKRKGDTVYVSQINAPTGQLLDAQTANSFTPEKLSTTRIAIRADRRAVASYEFDDIIDLQSQITLESSPIRDALRQAVAEQINGHLYSLVAPSAATPDHVINSITDFDAAQLSNLRKLAAQARWKKDNWTLLLDPEYYSDLLNSTTIVSSDFGASDTPIIGGQLALKRHGFTILEDNSDGILSMGAAAGGQKALAFHPDFLHLVMQTQPTFKLSDLHPNKEFGYILSLDLVFGSAIGIDGNRKHITVEANAPLP